jgi:antirestriction protein ArdC
VQRSAALTPRAKEQSHDPLPHTDVYTRVTSKIIADLEQGVRTWIKPWNAEHAAGRIIRPLRHSGTPYRDVNVLLLWCEAMEKGFNAPIWMTFKQAQELGANVRKGEHGSLVVYADRFTKTETDDKGAAIEREIPFMKGYTVFNVEQIDGLPAHYTAKAEEPPEPMARIEHAEGFFAATGATIKHGGNRAFYAPCPDLVQMPPRESFRDAESYCATLAHELTHKAAFLIMPRSHPYLAALLGLATRRFGIIRGLLETREACHRVGIAPVMLASPQYAPVPALSVVGRRGCRPAWFPRTHGRARAR